MYSYVEIKVTVVNWITSGLNFPLSGGLLRVVRKTLVSMQANVIFDMDPSGVKFCGH